MKRFAIIGTHSTGKSTLVEKLAERNPDIYFTHSVTRTVTTKEERALKEVSDDIQKKILSKIEEEEQRLLKINESQDILLDRSYIDFVAYTEAFYKSQHVSEQFFNDILDGLVSRIYDRIPFSYDTLFYLPIEFDIVDDGIRSTDDQLRKEVDENIQRYLNVIKLKMPVVVVKGTLEERLKIIENAITG